MIKFYINVREAKKKTLINYGSKLIKTADPDGTQILQQRTIYNN